MSTPAITPALLAGPAMAPPPGVIPNLVNPPSTGPILVILGGILVGLMALVVGNRVLTKAFIVRSWAWDDVTCLIGAVLTTAYYAISVVAVQQAQFGTHQWNVPLRTYLSDTTAEVEYCSEVLAPITLLAIKATVFILFLHLFQPVRAMRWAVYGGLVFTVVFYVLAFVLAFVSATPRPGETWLEHEEFNPLIHIEVTAAIWLPSIGLVIDLYILILPLYCVSKLHLPLRRKIATCAIFMTGVLAVVASILSLFYRVYIYQQPLDDLTFHQLQVLITSIVEMTLGVMIACAPTLSRMSKHVQPGWSRLRSHFSSRRSDTEASGAGRTFASSKSNLYSARTHPPKQSISSVDDVELAGLRGTSYTHISSHAARNPSPALPPQEGIQMHFDVRRETGRETAPAGTL